MSRLRARHARNKLVVGRKKANTGLTRQEHSAACRQQHCKTSTHESTNKGAGLRAWRGRDLSLAELVDQYRVQPSWSPIGPIRKQGKKVGGAIGERFLQACRSGVVKGAILNS